jgi:hypothetical protein
MNTINTNIQVFLYRAEMNHNEKYIKTKLSELGVVDRLDFIEKTDNATKKKYNSVIITFTKWNFNPKVEEVYRALLDTKSEKPQYKFWHNEKYYWILQKHTPARTETPPPVSSVTLSEREIQEIQLENCLLREQMRIMEQKMLEMEEEKRHDYSRHCAIRDTNDDLQIYISQLENTINRK